MAALLPSLYFLFAFLLPIVSSDNIPPEEKQALLSFTHSVTQRPKSDYLWDESKPICHPEDDDQNWKGVGCDDTKTTVIHLKIPGAIGGVIQPQTIGNLLHLVVLNLRENQLKSPFPEDFAKLEKLTHLRLNNNRFSGTIPDHFSKLVSLTHVYLDNNKFSGEIPGYFSNLKLEEFNVSYNNFSGEIPESLSRFDKSAFEGNRYLCGHPLPTLCKKSSNGTGSPGFVYPPAPQPAESQAEETPTPAKEKELIVGVSVGSGLLLLMLLCCLGKKTINKPPPPSPADASRASATEDERREFVFFDNAARGINRSFDMEDLYRATQVVLGNKGTVGTSIKMLIDEGATVVVVKRLKDDHLVVTKDGFESTMEVLGKMKKSKYVVPLVAYYYSEDKKLVVYEYMAAGSLFDRLHGWQDFGETGLNWDQRMRIALSAARGVEYLHAAKVVHGNIKSSNILLRQETNKYVASVSDYGLSTLFGSLTSQNHYQAPEVTEIQKVTFESDVYSFGVLLLELLTGKDPNGVPSGNEGTEFPMWVQSIIHGKPSVEVFDVELWSHQNIEEELVHLLQIAKDCVMSEPDRRPIMQKVVSMMENMNIVEMDDRLRQSSDDHSRAFDDTPSTETRDTPSTITP